MREVLAIALFGALGAVGRFVVTAAVGRLPHVPLPIGTLVVNVAGSFLLGVVAALAFTTSALSPTWRAAIATGFLGSFTTFSTFSVETVDLAGQGQWKLAALNLGTQLGFGLTAALAGLALGRSLAN